MGRSRSRVVALCLGAGLTIGCAKDSTPPPRSEEVIESSPAPDLEHWPHQLKLADAAFTIYQPQVESWQGNQLAFRCAVAAKPTGGGAESFGVIWANARTEVDRVTRMVALEDVKLTRSNFPTVADGGAGYLAELQTALPVGARRISLDRLEASLAATAAAPKGVAVNNSMPRIIVSQSPAILIPIAGKPVLRAVPGHSFERVINTRALIARATGGTTYYAHVYDGWLSAAAITGPWSASADTPAQLDPLATELAESGDVVLLDGGNAQPKPSLAQGAPTLYVSSEPAELVVFQGAPVFEKIPGTKLHVATNTLSDVLVDDLAGVSFLLVSGRWYQTQSLLKGPWRYVPSSQLPPDFARIPPDSRAGVVLAAVAGTPQASEAAIENSIPQTASVARAGGAGFTATYDGPVKLAPITGTPLQYVQNSPTPIVRVAADSWYALSGGVWFVAAESAGPWVVAASVPEVIYGIPTTSSLHYVTYVHVYGATEEVVYVGYTPGYLGTVVTPDGVVVYGTGYEYDPWIGTVYYAAPATYGVMAQPVYNPAVGWSYGYAMGLTTAAMVGYWGGTGYVYAAGYHGYPCCGSASANVYRNSPYVHSSGEVSYSTNKDGVVEQRGGNYTNEATGTHGGYHATETWDPSTGQRNLSTDRGFETQRGTSGDVSHNAGYNYDTGRYSGSSSMSATGAGGSTLTRTGESQAGAGQVPVSAHESTYTSARTGQTTQTASIGNDHFASADGNVYKNTGDGWQKAGSNGWGNAGGDNSWADRESAARSQGESRASRSGGGGFGGGGGGGRDYGSHFGGGGFGDRFGEGGRGGGGRRR